MAIPLPLSVALLMEHPVPFRLLKPVLDALVIDWADVPTSRLVDSLLAGSAEIKPGVDGKDNLAIDVLPRLTWTVDLADETMRRAWDVHQSATPYFHMSCAITQGVAPFTSPEARSRVLIRAMHRSGPEPEGRPAAVQAVVDNVLALGVNVEVAPDQSPFLTVRNIATYERLVAAGFSLSTTGQDGRTVADMVVDRSPETFESPSERTRILAALPTLDLSPVDLLLHKLSKAKRWSDVRAALKEMGPGWVNERFEDGDTVVHKIADWSDEWAVKALALPAVRNAPQDIAVDGQGTHLIWRMAVANPGLIEQADQELSNVPAWHNWARFTPRPVDGLTGTLQSIARHFDHAAQTKKVSRSSLAVDAPLYYWGPNVHLESLMRSMGSTVLEALHQGLSDPAFQRSVDAVVWNWPNASHAYYATEKLLAPLIKDSEQKGALKVNLPSDLSPADTVWITTHLMGDCARYLALARTMPMVKQLITMGANWQTLQDRFQEGRLAWDGQGDKRNLWEREVRQHWEFLVFCNDMRNDDTPVAAPRVRTRL